MYTVASSPHLTSSLRGTGLGGSIPTEINMLSNLQTLYISGNALSLGIPDLSNLVSLTKLCVPYATLAAVVRV